MVLLNQNIHPQRKEVPMSVKRISKVEELFPALYEIGTNKNRLPMELRGWVNVLDLYVQLRYKELLISSMESLVAGGKWIGYFAATCFYPAGTNGTKAMIAPMFGDFSNWEIKKFNQQVWEKRFAHLVEPTYEIARYLFIPDMENATRTYEIEEYKIQWLPKLVNAVNHFKSTGKWVGLHNFKCLSCGKGVSFWTYLNSEPCPYCSGKVRDENIKR